MASSLPPLITPFGHATQLRVESFLQHVLPPLPDGISPSQTLRNLIRPTGKSRTQRAITQKGRWKGFPSDPAETETNQRKIFQNIEGVLSAILQASGCSVAPVAFLHNSPPNQINVRRSSKSYPDLCLARGDNTWASMLTFGELRKSSTQLDMYENIEKVTCSMAKWMSDDPRRRFTHAFTIENTDMRLWFCDRSQIVVSQPFNFICDHLPVVHFFLSITNASDVDLGLDPTMIPWKDTQRYDVVLRTDHGEVRTYRTLELLASYPSDILFGRGTRVWTAIQIKDGEETGEPVALKDAWVDLNRVQEGTICERIQLADRPPEYTQPCEDLFPTVDCHGDVVLGEGTAGVLDNTRCLEESGARIGASTSTREQLIHSLDAWRTSRDGPSSKSATSDPKRRSVKRLVHYRIVFHEVCTTLCDETSLSAVFRALARIALALKHVHVAGWVHRDMSHRNILVQNGLARLSDFEYAKEVGVGKDSSLGTAKFVAGEIKCQTYRFLPGLTPPPSPDDPQNLPNSLSGEPIINTHVDGASAGREPPTVPAVRHNPLHDLESLWWIAVYFVVQKEIIDGTDPETQGKSASRDQRAFAASLFDDSKRRQITFEVPNYFLFHTDTLPPVLSPIIMLLERLRRSLISQYHAAERNIGTIDGNSAGELHRTFHCVFDSIAEAEQCKTLTVRPFTPVYAVMNNEWRNFDHTGRGRFQHRHRIEFTPSPARSERDGDGEVPPRDPGPSNLAETGRKKRKRTADDVPPTSSLLGPRRSRPYLGRKAKS